MRNPFLLASGALFLLLSFLLIGEQLPARTENPNKWKIVFVSTRDGNEEIYVMDLDGKNQKNLTKNPARDENPYWSPDKRKIIFESDRAENDKNYSKNPLSEKWPSLKRENRSGHTEIYSMNPDGTGLKNLTGNQWAHSLPRIRKGVSPFSPDGKKILFRSFGEKPGLYTMNSDGTEPRWLASGEEGAWSPDGKWIVYENDVFLPGMPSQTGHRIFAIRKDGTGKRMVTPVAPNVAYNEEDRDATFSPDGKWILFVSTRGPKSDRGESDWKSNYARARMFHVFMIRANGTGLKQLTVGSIDGESPRFLDKDRIIYSSNRFTPSYKKNKRLGMQLFILNIRKETTTLINTGLPGDSFFEQYVPQKKRILLTTHPDIADLDYQRLFIVREDGKAVSSVTNHPGYDGDPHI